MLATPKDVIGWVQSASTFYLLFDDLGHNAEMISGGYPTWFIAESELVAKLMADRFQLYPEAKEWIVTPSTRADVAKHLELLRKAVDLKFVSIVHFVDQSNVATATFAYEEFHLALNYIFTGQHKHESSLLP